MTATDARRAAESGSVAPLFLSSTLPCRAPSRASSSPAAVHTCGTQQQRRKGGQCCDIGASAIERGARLVGPDARQWPGRVKVPQAQAHAEEARESGVDVADGDSAVREGCVGVLCQEAAAVDVGARPEHVAHLHGGRIGLGDSTRNKSHPTPSAPPPCPSMPLAVRGRRTVSAGVDV